MMDLRMLGIAIGDRPSGPKNSITDVPGVRVGHSTIIDGAGELRPGAGPVRTGVTVLQPVAGPVRSAPVFAGAVSLNGNGDLTGLEWVRESGLLTTPIGLTNTFSVGTVRDALAEYDTRISGVGGYWSLPVVGETYDGLLNDIHGQHVTRQHVFDALDAASDAPVEQGNVGGGTGMVCHEFKGGIGSSSRQLREAEGGWTVGAMVQANYGERPTFRVDGVPVGRILADRIPVPTRAGVTPGMPGGSGSIIIVLATDAPLLPADCRRLAMRSGTGLARVGGSIADGSGDIAIAFATGNDAIPSEFYQLKHSASGVNRRPAAPLTFPLNSVSHQSLDPLFEAAAEATEEAIINALLAADTMTGRDDVTVNALEPDLLIEAMKHHRYEFDDPSTPYRQTVGLEVQS